MRGAASGGESPAKQTAGEVGDTIGTSVLAV